MLAFCRLALSSQSNCYSNSYPLHSAYQFNSVLCCLFKWGLSRLCLDHNFPTIFTSIMIHQPVYCHSGLIDLLVSSTVQVCCRFIHMPDMQINFCYHFLPSMVDIDIPTNLGGGGERGSKNKNFDFFSFFFAQQYPSPL